MNLLNKHEKQFINHQYEISVLLIVPEVGEVLFEVLLLVLLPAAVTDTENTQVCSAVT